MAHVYSEELHDCVDGTSLDTYSRWWELFRWGKNFLLPWTWLSFVL